MRDPDTHGWADTALEVLALPYQSTAYELDAAGRMTQMSDPEGNLWNYEYDFAGRQTVADDPDAGTTTTTYDELDRVDALNGSDDTLAYEYDALGRKVKVRDGNADGNLRAEWKYDTAKDRNGHVVLGQLGVRDPLRGRAGRRPPRSLGMTTPTGSFPRLFILCRLRAVRGCAQGDVIHHLH